MSGTGYASIGQLFELSNNQSLDGLREALQPLISKLYVYLDDDVIDPMAYQKLDSFFKSIENQKQKLNIESATKFIGGILKRHGVDDVSFQLEVEKAVWDLLKCNPTFYQIHKSFRSKSSSSSEKNTEDTKLLHLFCIFNRFCESNMNRMMISAHYSNFLVSRILGDSTSKLGRLNFVDFFQHIGKCQGDQVTASIKLAYDEYARDVLVESHLSLRTRKYLSNKKKSEILGPIVHGTATLTSTILRVAIDELDTNDSESESEDEHSDHKDKKHDRKKSPAKSKEKLKYLEINMIGASEELDTIKEGFKAIKNREGKTTDSDHRFVYKIRGYDSDVGIDLIFNKVKELSEFNQWREALVESKEIIQTRVNRLAEAKRSVINASCAEGDLDLPTRFSNKTMPEMCSTLNCVSRSRYSFKNKLGSKSSMRRSASQSQLPVISGEQDNPPPIPRKSDKFQKGNHYSDDPIISSRNDNSQPSNRRMVDNAPPIPIRSSPRMDRKEISGAFANHYQESSSESDPSRVSIHVGDNRISNVLLAGSGGVELTRTCDTNDEENAYILDVDAIAGNFIN